MERAPWKCKAGQTTDDQISRIPSLGDPMFQALIRCVCECRTGKSKHLNRVPGQRQALCRPSARALISAPSQLRGQALSKSNMKRGLFDVYRPERPCGGRRIICEYLQIQSISSYWSTDRRAIGSWFLSNISTTDQRLPVNRAFDLLSRR